jgi:hypothetical protein
MTKLSDLQAIAIEYRRALADTNSIKDYDARMAAIEGLGKKFAGMPVNGVGVSAIIPENRTVFRRPHYRFQYFVNGKRASEADARLALLASSNR